MARALHSAAAMSRSKELEHRVEAKKRQLQARLAELQADAHGKGSEEETRVRSKLAEIEHHLKAGWHNLSESAAGKVNDWLKKA